MAYVGPLSVSVDRHDQDVPERFARDGFPPFITYNDVTSLWHLVAVAGGGGGDNVALVAADRGNIREAEAEARAALDPDGTIPL